MSKLHSMTAAVALALAAGGAQAQVSGGRAEAAAPLC